MPALQDKRKAEVIFKQLNPDTSLRLQFEIKNYGIPMSLEIEYA
jgi:hypothetical protein